MPVYLMSRQNLYEKHMNNEGTGLAMKYLVEIARKNTGRIAAVSLVLGLMLSNSLAAQQAVSGGNGQTGTIQQLNQDDGSLTISGQVYAYSDTVTQVTIDGNTVRVEVLTEGMVVRYTLDGSGTLARLEIIGPAAKVRELSSN